MTSRRCSKRFGRRRIARVDQRLVAFGATRASRRRAAPTRRPADTTIGSADTRSGDRIHASGSAVTVSRPKHTAKRQRAALAALQLVQVAVGAREHRRRAQCRASASIAFGNTCQNSGSATLTRDVAAADRRDRRGAQALDFAAVAHRAEAAEARRRRGCRDSRG